MKKRPLSLLAACALASALPVIAQDKPATPTPTPAPTPDSPAAATPTPEPAKMDATAVAESPTNPRAEAPSPVSATAAESEAAAHAAEPTPPPVELPPADEPEPVPPPADGAQPTPPPKTDADYLPEPTDASLGAPIEGLPTDGATSDDLPNPDSLIPADVTEAAGLEDQPPAAPKIQENKYDSDRRLAVRYQEVKLQALKDPAIRSLRQQADNAKTDEGKRQAMRAYYRMLFGKMVGIDATLKDKCDTMELAYLRRMGQYKVAPTIPLHPPPTPEPLAN